MKNLLIYIALISLAAGAVAQTTTQSTEPAETDQNAPRTLHQLAQGADFIGLVQVQGIDYEITRSLPSEGYALLNTLIVYRHAGEDWEEPNFIQVFEEGFAENACYYPERWNEGRRFLAFLQKREKKDGYKGVKPYCMLPVLITDELRYVLRYPVPGVKLTDPSAVRKITFNDPDAYVEPGEDIPYSQARSFEDAGYLKKTENNRYVFTRGIPLGDARQLMFDEPPSQEPNE